MEKIAVYTTSQVAKRAFVDPSTVRQWVSKGQLKPIMTTPGGQYRFAVADVEALLAPAETGAA